MNTIYINNGSFHMETCPEMLPEFPMRNLHKLFRLMFAAQSENTDATAGIEAWIPGAVQKAESNLITARANHAAEYWSSSSRYTRGKLNAAVKAAEADYDKILKIKNAFEKEK